MLVAIDKRDSISLLRGLAHDTIISAQCYNAFFMAKNRA